MSSEAFLANAALLKVAPSLGCLKEYIKIVTDLCVANKVPIPDFKCIQEYIPMTPSIIPPTLVETYENEPPGITETQAQVANKYKSECLSDDIDIKHEPLNEYTDNIAGNEIKAEHSPLKITETTSFAAVEQGQSNQQHPVSKMKRHTQGHMEGISGW